MPTLPDEKRGKPRSGSRWKHGKEKYCSNCLFVLFVGTKKPVKRREFEPFIREKLGISVAPEDLQISGEFFHTMAWEEGRYML